ncbi:DUF4012 domain-containing protein [Microbacterium sp. 18062]|uniref:DUF4012 domain-containing protein n=1 Tax=Microbacterium sp. 18062 TaxID=2681410 RepID=UPI001359352B|nr:DUF4012 domain-containing protein [Microbacterium sp. 18062]
MARRRTRIAVLGGVLLGIVVAAAAGSVVARALEVQDELGLAGSAAHEAASAYQAGDPSGATDAVERLRGHAAHAAGLSDDPLWRAAEIVPVIGANLAAVRIGSAQLDALADRVATPVLELMASTADSGTGADVAALAAASETLETARATVRGAERALDELERTALVPQVAAEVDTLAEALAAVAPVVEMLADAGGLVPDMLGIDGSRRVLVMVQNTAELRTGGGITGTFIELIAVDGELTLGQQRDSSHFVPADRPLAALPAGETASFGDGIGRFVQNASMTADFDVTGRLASEWWRSATGNVPDAVVSIDPIVLQAVLAVTGPIEAGDQSLDAGNLVDRLLVEPYVTLAPEQQDGAFARIAESVFARLTSGDLDLLRLFSALQQPVADGRVSVWSAHAAEQSALIDTALGGPQARQRLAGEDAFAVYFNDATGGKMTPFLDIALGAGSAVCRDDGRAEVVVTATLTSAAPADAATALPVSVTGGGIWGAAVGDIAPTVTVAAPAGWYFGGVRLDGALVSSQDVDADGVSASTRRTDLAPGRTRTLEFRFVSPEPGAVTPTVLHTPLLQEVDVEARVAECG